jgi:hypothetical protein
MRFVIIVAAVAIFAVLGLFIYGQMLEPETQQIEQDVSVDADA